MNTEGPQGHYNSAMRLLAITLLIFCAAACARKPAPAATAGVAVQSAPAATATPAAPPAAPPAVKAEPKKPAVGSPHGDAYTANKTHHEGTREGDKALERDLADLRPKNREYVSLSGKRIHVNFTGAKEGPPGSHLCDLSFELTDGEHSTTATMTDKQRKVGMAVDLGWCKVKVKPVVSSADVQPIGAGEVASRVTRAGSYDLVLLTSAGKTMATAQLTWDRRLIAGYASPGYECFMRRDPEWEDEMIYSIVKTTGDEAKVLQLRWYDKALAHQQVVDKAGSIFEYAFPDGEFEVIKPGA
jgi:hypothetical protein